MSFLITFFLIPFVVLPPFWFSFMYEYILDLTPTNSVMGTPHAISLNLPMTFLFFLSKNCEFSGYSRLSNHFYRPKSSYNRLLFVFDMWNCQCLWIIIWPCHGICSWSYCDENRTWVFLTDLEYLCPSKRVWLLLLFCELGQDCHERFCCLRMLALNCVYIIFFHQ